MWWALNQLVDSFQPVTKLAWPNCCFIPKLKSYTFLLFTRKIFYYRATFINRIMIGLIMQIMENKILVLACLNIFCTLPLLCISLWLPLGSDSTDRELFAPFLSNRWSRPANYSCTGRVAGEGSKFR